MNEENKSWMQDPVLQKIDAAKLQMLSSLAAQGQKKSQKELLPFLMAAASRSKANGTSFTNEETDLILQVLKQGRTPEEAAKMERLVMLIQRMKGVR